MTKIEKKLNDEMDIVIRKYSVINRLRVMPETCNKLSNCVAQLCWPAKLHSQCQFSMCKQSPNIYGF